MKSPSASTVRTNLLARIGDASSCLAWTRSIADRSVEQRLSAISGLFSELSRSDRSSEALLEIAEQVRLVHIPTLEESFETLNTHPLPLPQDQLDAFAIACKSIVAGRILYKRLFVNLLEQSNRGVTRRGYANAPVSMRAVMPLIRAIDYQSRLLMSHLAVRIELGEPEWQELYDLARHAKYSRMADEPMIDLAVSGTSAAARDLVAAPLLLAAFDPSTLDTAELALTTWLVRRWADRVGYRLVDSAEDKPHSHGPTVGTGSENVFKLDTRRVARALQKRADALVDDRVANRSAREYKLSVDALRSLMQRLQQRLEPDRGELHLRRAKTPTIPIVFGLLHVHDAALVMHGSAEKHATPRAFYAYSRGAADTLTAGVVFEDASARAAIAEVLESQAEPISCIGESDQVWQFQTGSDGRPLKLHQLATAQTGVRGGAVLFRCGRISKLQQSAAVAGKPLPACQFEVTYWRGNADPVGIAQADDAMRFEDAWCIAGDRAAGEPPSLVMRFGAFSAGKEMVLRELVTDELIVLDRLLERGLDFDRIAFTRIAKRSLMDRR